MHEQNVSDMSPLLKLSAPKKIVTIFQLPLFNVRGNFNNLLHRKQLQAFVNLPGSFVIQSETCRKRFKELRLSSTELDLALFNYNS